MTRSPAMNQCGADAVDSGQHGVVGRIVVDVGIEDNREFGVDVQLRFRLRAILSVVR